eukprot:tig00020703_g13130.t1
MRSWKKAPETPRRRLYSSSMLSSPSSAVQARGGSPLARLGPTLCAGPGATCPSARFLARRLAGCFSVVDSRLCAGPGATCPSARFPARRLAGCFSVVDSRLCAGHGATCPSARFPARRLAGCFSVVDSRLCAGHGATCPSARFPARRRLRLPACLGRARSASIHSPRWALVQY